MERGGMSGHESRNAVSSSSGIRSATPINVTQLSACGFMKVRVHLPSRESSLNFVDRFVMANMI